MHGSPPIITTVICRVCLHGQVKGSIDFISAIGLASALRPRCGDYRGPKRSLALSQPQRRPYNHAVASAEA